MDNIEKKYVLEGKVKSALGNMQFVVEIDLNGKKHDIRASISGKMKKNSIRVYVGDKVRLEISSLDPKKGSIIFRL